MRQNQPKKSAKKQKEPKKEVTVNLPIPERPSFAEKLIFPDDITELQGKNITDLMGKYTKLHAYVKSEWWKLKKKELTLERNLNEAKRDVYFTDPAVHTNSNKLKYNTKVFGINGELNQIKQSVLVAESYLETYDRYIQTLSRELTRKAGAKTGTDY